MKITVCNPQKGRLETIDIEFNENNTTWLDQHSSPRDIHMITDDLDGGAPDQRIRLHVSPLDLRCIESGYRLRQEKSKAPQTPVCVRPTDRSGW